MNEAPKKRGRPQKFSDAALLRFLGSKPKSVETIAEQLGQKVGTVYSRLRKLLETGMVEKTRIGRGVFWMRPAA